MNYYSAALPTQHGTVSEFHVEAPQATASAGLAQGPYVAVRAGFESMIFRAKGVESTNEPSRPTNRQEHDDNEDGNGIATALFDIMLATIFLVQRLSQLGGTAWW